MDLIDRQEAIEKLSKGALANYNASGDDFGLIKAIDVIKAIPAKRGKWETVEGGLWQGRHRKSGLYTITFNFLLPPRSVLEDANDYEILYRPLYRCSCCGSLQPDEQSYCANCGAYMKWEKDE